MKFRTVIQSNGKTATGIEVPAHVVAGLGGGKRPKVRVTIHGRTYRSSIAVMGGKAMIGVSAENRARTGVTAGDRVDVDVELDTQRRAVTLPDDFIRALARDAPAKTFFATLSYSQQRWFVDGIVGAKKPETRQRRIDAAIERLHAGRGQR